MRVAINAGHCPGLDAGAVGPTGLQEADVTKDVANKIISFLVAAGVEAHFIQENELAAITDSANAFNVDLFVSVHCNAAENPAANGAEIFTTVGQTYADMLASCIMAQVEEEFPDLFIRSDYADGDVDKESNFYVLRNTDAPAVLIELAFISNPEEEQLLADEAFLDRYAAAIARGITDFQV